MDNSIMFGKATLLMPYQEEEAKAECHWFIEMLCIKAHIYEDDKIYLFNLRCDVKIGRLQIKVKRANEFINNALGIPNIIKDDDHRIFSHSALKGVDLAKGI